MVHPSVYSGGVCVDYCLLVLQTQKCYHSVTERGQWAVFHTSPQSFIVKFSYLLAQQLWGLLLNFDWLVYEVECPNVSTINCNLQNR